MFMQRVNLFCIPYAGGSSLIFNRWKACLNDHIELRPIELAGRGKRAYEALYRDIDAAVEDVFNRIHDQLDQPYALFGHSMGSRIVFELARKIKREKVSAPVHIFFSGSGAPHKRNSNEKIFHLMKDDEFREEVISLGGTPAELFQHPELQELFVPLLKNDFRISECYKAPGEIQPFDSSITVFVGKDDDLDSEECNGWKNYTTAVCTLHYLNGGHFFLHRETEILVELINNVLLTYLKSRTSNQPWVAR
jgi:medium-chain acyl-[acyl-carrier-protein] hydrolase